MKIELSQNILVYTGRSHGSEDRKRFGLKVQDGVAEIVPVIVPDSVYTMTSSYFLGLFGESIRELGRDGFLRKYPVTSPPHVARKIEDWISRALREKKGLFGGDI